MNKRKEKMLHDSQWSEKIAVELVSHEDDVLHQKFKLFVTKALHADRVHDYESLTLTMREQLTRIFLEELLLAAR